MIEFGCNLEKATIQTVEEGKMTKDLVLIVKGTQNVERKDYCSTEEFIEEVGVRIKKFYTK